VIARIRNASLAIEVIPSSRWIAITMENYNLNSWTENRET